MPSPLGVASGYSHNGLPLLLCLSLPFPFGLERREFPPRTSLKTSTQKAGINNRNDAAGPVRIESGMDLPAGATYLLTGEQDSGRQFVSQGQKLLASCNFEQNKGGGREGGKPSSVTSLTTITQLHSSYNVGSLLMSNVVSVL